MDPKHLLCTAVLDKGTLLHGQKDLKECTFFKTARYSPRELKLVASPDSLLFFELVSKPNSFKKRKGLSCLKPKEKHNLALKIIFFYFSHKLWWQNSVVQHTGNSLSFLHVLSLNIRWKTWSASLSRPAWSRAQMEQNYSKQVQGLKRKEGTLLKSLFFVPPWETLGSRAWTAWWWGPTRGSGWSRGPQTTSSSGSPRSPRRNGSMFLEWPTRPDLPKRDTVCITDSVSSPTLWGRRASLSWWYMMGLKTSLDLILQPSAPAC